MNFLVGHFTSLESSPTRCDLGLVESPTVSLRVCRITNHDWLRVSQVSKSGYVNWPSGSESRFSGLTVSSYPTCKITHVGLCRFSLSSLAQTHFQRFFVSLSSYHLIFLLSFFLLIHFINEKYK